MFGLGLGLTSAAALQRHPAVASPAFDPDFDYIQGAPSSLSGASYAGDAVTFSGNSGFDHAEWAAAETLEPGTYQFTASDVLATETQLRLYVGALGHDTSSGGASQVANSDGATFSATLVVGSLASQMVRIEDLFANAPEVSNPTLKRVA